MGSMASTVASSIFESCTFAALTRTASGMPWASTTRWRFVPCLPRSVGFLPVSWPLPCGRHRGGVQRSPVPVDAVGLGQLFEKPPVQPAPDARLVPVSQPAPARHPAPTPHLGRQVLPEDARLQHEQDPRQRRPVRHQGPSALGLRRLRREQRRDPRPQRLRQQFLRHGTLLHGSYSASLAAYATVLLGVLSGVLSAHPPGATHWVSALPHATSGRQLAADVAAWLVYAQDCSCP